MWTSTFSCFQKGGYTTALLKIKKAKSSKHVIPKDHSNFSPWMGVLRPSGFKDETEAAVSLVRFFAPKK
jgi:hypothetical protein